MNAALDDMTRATILDALRTVALAVRRGDLSRATALAALEANPLELPVPYSNLVIPSKS